VTATGEKATRVVTRRVHYFSGFDPRGAGHYHRLYREESQKQSSHNGAQIGIGTRTRLNEIVSTWRVDADWSGQQTHTDYQFMHWDDLVRANWQRNAVRLWMSGLWPYLQLLSCGAWLRIWKIAKPVAISGAFPLVLFVFSVVAALLVGVMACGAALWLGLGWGLSLFAGGISAVVIMWGGLLLSEKLGGQWLLRTFLFVYEWGTGNRPQLEPRLKRFAQHIIEEQKKNPVDEVLLVGHSIGTMVAVEVAARISNEGYSINQGSALRLLTLGQCIPVLSFIPEAKAFREALASMTKMGAIPWTDVTIPPDPLCFYNLDPVKVSGGNAPPSYATQLAIARVFRMFKKETYATLRWNKLRLHFQYLMASELPADYDYFLMTAGPHTLAESLTRCEIEMKS